MLPPQAAPALFGLILSGLMSLLVSGISTYRAVGFGEPYAGLWLGAWLTAWVAALVLAAPPRSRMASSITLKMLGLGSTVMVSPAAGVPVMVNDRPGSPLPGPLNVSLIGMLTGLLLG